MFFGSDRFVIYIEREGVCVSDTDVFPDSTSSGRSSICRLMISGSIRGR